MTLVPESNDKPLRPNIMAVLFHPISLNVFIGRINNTTDRFSHKYSPVEGGTDNQPPHVALHREMAEEIGLPAREGVIFVAAFDRTVGYRFNGHARHGGKEEAVAFYLAQPAFVQSINLNPGLTNEAPAFREYAWVSPFKAREFLKMGADYQRRTFVNRVADGIDEVWYALRLSLGAKPADVITRRAVSLPELASRAQNILKIMGEGFTVNETSMPVPCSQTPQEPTGPRQRSMLYRAARQYIRSLG